MLNLSQILQRIRAGQIPDSWRVIRAQNQVRFVTMSAAIAFGFTFNVVFFGTGSIILYNSSHEQLGNNLIDAYTHYPFPAILTQVTIIGMVFLFRWWAIRARNAVFVMLPEGIVHYKRVDKHAGRYAKLIAYEQIQRMVLDVSRGSDYLQVKTATFDLTASDLGSLQEKEPVPDMLRRFEFQIFYRDGMRETWFPPQGYEKKPGEIAQWVLDDYRAFAIGKFHRRESRSAGTR